MNAHKVEMGCLIKLVEHDGRYTKVHSENCSASWREFSLTAAVLELELREAYGLEGIEMAISIFREYDVPALHKSLLEAIAWTIRFAYEDDAALLPFRKDFARAILEVTDSEYLAHKAIRELDRVEACALFASGPLAQFFEKRNATPGCTVRPSIRAVSRWITYCQIASMSITNCSK